MIRIAFASLGCKTNQYESDALAEWFRRQGFFLVDDSEEAEVYVLNTCTVTAEAERKARQLLRRYRKQSECALVVACGCYAQRVDLSDLADISAGTVGRSRVPALIVDALIERGILESFSRDTGSVKESSYFNEDSVRVSPYREEDTVHNDHMDAINDPDGAMNGMDFVSGHGDPINSLNDLGSMACDAGSLTYGSWDTFCTDVGKGYVPDENARGLACKGFPEKDIPYEELPAPAIPRETRAFLKVQDGCDNRCAYCAISLARGPSRSRKLSNIIEEAQELVEHGFSEIVLTGTNLNLYGSEFRLRSDASNDGAPLVSAPLELSALTPESASNLGDVIVALDRVKGVKRLRLGSLESGLITDEFIEKIIGVKSLCPSFHLSLQSGSDRILKAMRRRDTRDSYREAVVRLREAFPGAGITTDLIVGFPGETQDDFEETLSFCDEIGFLRIHVFRFSARPGTLAYTMPHQVASSIAAERSGILRKKAAQLAEAAIRERIGKTRAVLIEKHNAFGQAEGYTPEYIFVNGIVRQGLDLSGVSDRDVPAKGSIVQMRIVGVDEQTAIAEVL